MFLLWQGEIGTKADWIESSFCPFVVVLIKEYEFKRTLEDVLACFLFYGSPKEKNLKVELLWLKKSQETLNTD